MINDIYYKRHLPHYHPEEFAYFITFRLANSLPISVILKLLEDREKELHSISAMTDHKQKAEAYYSSQHSHFTKFDSLLDNSASGPNWLRQKEIADIVFNSILFRDTKEYDLIAFTIMPNHVHLVLIPINKVVGRIADPSPEITNNGNVVAPSDDIKDISGFENILGKGRNSVASYKVSKILQDLKKYTGRECNKILNRSGAFWQQESYVIFGKSGIGII